jgi:hypothetical protein
VHLLGHKRWRHWLMMVLLMSSPDARPDESETESDETYRRLTNRRIDEASTKYCDFVSARVVLAKGSIERFKDLLDKPSAEELRTDALELVGKVAQETLKAPPVRTSPTTALAANTIGQLITAWLDQRRGSEESEVANDWAAGTAVVRDLSRTIDDFQSLCSSSGAKGSRPQLAYIISNQLNEMDRASADEFLDSLHEWAKGLKPKSLPRAEEFDARLLETYINRHVKFRDQGYIAIDIDVELSGEITIQSVTVKAPLGSRVEVLLLELIRQRGLNIFTDIKTHKKINVNTMKYHGSALVDKDGARVLAFDGNVAAELLVQNHFDDIKALPLPHSSE